MSSTPLLLTLCGAWLLAGCASTPPDGPPPSMLARMAANHTVLLGEVHDNAQVHRVRLQALRAAVDNGWRPAIAMEQFDRERQPDIDRARRERPHDADYLIRAAGAQGWNWDFYRPVVQLALDHGLPLVAANLSRADAMRVAQQGFVAALPPLTVARYHLDDGVPPALLAAQREQIGQSHCGMVPEEAMDGMARAQIARDVTMAEALRAWSGKGVVLLAGNGHVRRDLGVPQWLPGVYTVGFVESEAAGEFDDVLPFKPPAGRADPCAGMKPQG